MTIRDADFRRMFLTLTLLALPPMAAACGEDAATDADAGAEKPVNTPLPKDSWVSLGFDLGSTYNNTHETKLTLDNAKDLKEAWTFTALGSVTGAPCIIGKYAYVSSLGRAYKIALADGTKVWENKDGGGSASPACTNETMYVDTSGADLVAIDLETGKTRWKVQVDEHKLASGFSSPIIAGDKILLGTSSIEETSATDTSSFRGSVVAFDRDSGDELWRFYTVGQGWTGATVWSTVSVSMQDSMVYVGTGNNYTGEANELSDAILALELDTGELVWSTQLTEGDVFTTQRSNGNPDDDFGANPIVFDAMVDGTMRSLVGAGQKSGTFWVLDRTDGSMVWHVDISGGGALTGGVLNNGAFDGERLLAVGNNGKSKGPGSEPAEAGQTSRLVAMEAGTGKIAWERQLPALVWAPITIANGVGFVSANKEIQAFNTKTGERLFTLETKGTIGCGASISDGHVVFGSGFQYTPNIVRDNTLHGLVVP